MRIDRTSASLLLPLLLLPACSKGGTKLTSEVKVAASHNDVGYGGLAALQAWPISARLVTSDSFSFELRSSADYIVKRIGQRDSNPFPYILDPDGAFSIRVPSGNGTELWTGGYELDGPDAVHYFTKRAGFPVFYAGVKRLSGQPVLEGSWWAFGDSVGLMPKTTKVSQGGIGRAFGGEMLFDKAGAVTKASWLDSSADKGQLVLVTGQAKTFSSGEVTMTLSLKGGVAEGTRTFSGGISKNVGVLLHDDATKNAMGLLFLVRKSTKAPVLADLAGSWHIGTHTIFNNPNTNKNGLLAGLDAATGELKIEADGSFKIVVTGISQKPFTYQGTAKIGSAGAVEFEVLDQGRRWIGALDPEKHAIVIADHVTRATSRDQDFEVGVYLAVRKKVVKTP